MFQQPANQKMLTRNLAHQARALEARRVQRFFETRNEDVGQASCAITRSPPELTLVGAAIPLVELKANGS